MKFEVLTKSTGLFQNILMSNTCSAAEISQAATTFFCQSNILKIPPLSSMLHSFKYLHWDLFQYFGIFRLKILKTLKQQKHKQMRIM
jgi:hypothetical protein